MAEDSNRPDDLELTADDLQEIESALSQVTVRGDRYPKDLGKLSQK